MSTSGSHVHMPSAASSPTHLEQFHRGLACLEQELSLVAVRVTAGGLQAALVRTVHLVGQHIQQHLAVAAGAQVPAQGGSAPATTHGSSSIWLSLLVRRCLRRGAAPAAHAQRGLTKAARESLLKAGWTCAPGGEQASAAAAAHCRGHLQVNCSRCGTVGGALGDPPAPQELSANLHRPPQRGVVRHSSIIQTRGVAESGARSSNHRPREVTPNTIIVQLQSGRRTARRHATRKDLAAHLLKKERDELSISRSSSVLVRLPLWMRNMPRGEFTKNGCASWALLEPAVG